jgi:hypothetical protein
MKKNSLIIILIALVVSSAFGRNQNSPTTYDPADTSYRAAADQRQRELMTIKEAAEAAQRNSNKGKSLANAALAVTTAGALATCWTSWFGGAAYCKYWVAGMAASLLVKSYMGNASGTSGSTVDSVSTVDDPYNLGSGNSNGGATLPSYTEEPEYKDAQKVVAKLTKDGWKIDVNKGMITPPKGKPFSTAVVSSAAAMRAAGASEAVIKAYQDGMAKIPAIAAAKSADSGSSVLADDGVVGGAPAAAPTSAVSEGQADFASLNVRSKTDPMNRDPAQVAGLATNYNGSPIGVSADSLFMMIDRRYQHHQRNGSFIPGR